MSLLSLFIKYLLLIILCFPILSLVCLGILSRVYNGYIYDISRLNFFGLCVSIFELLLIVCLYVFINISSLVDLVSLFDFGLVSYSYGGIESINHVLYIDEVFEFRLGVDYISYYFIILTGLLFVIVFKTSKGIGVDIYFKYLVINLLLESFIIGSFLVQDLISFYVFFETMLPLFFVFIGIISGSDRKISAIFYLFIYTLIGSYFMFLGFLGIFVLIGSVNFQVLNLLFIDEGYQYVIWLCVFFAVLIKTPLWPFHLWLPKAHSEAPLGGSILLAGIILKLALYLVLRVILPFLPECSGFFMCMVYVLSVISVLYSSSIIFRQIDVKAIIAYSSIGHMGIIIMGVFSNNVSGIGGSILLSLSHGLVSPGLFMLLGGVLYGYYNTRILVEYRGINLIMPIFSLIFFLFTLGNMGTPLTGNFVGEFGCLYGVIKNNFFVGFLVCFSIVLSSGYSVYLYNRVTGGVPYNYLFYSLGVLNVPNIGRDYFFSLFVLIVLVFMLGVNPNMVFSDLLLSLYGLVY